MTLIELKLLFPTNFKIIQRACGPYRVWCRNEIQKCLFGGKFIKSTSGEWQCLLTSPSFNFTFIISACSMSSWHRRLFKSNGLNNFLIKVSKIQRVFTISISAVHVLLSKSYSDFIQIFLKTRFIQILSKLYRIFWKNLNKVFFPTLSRSSPDFVPTLSKFCPDFIWIILG